MKYTRIINILADFFDECEFYLKNGIEFPSSGRDEVIYTASAHFPKNIIMEIKVCNAETSAGGAFVDPVLFLDNKKYCQEVCVGEVGDSLDTNYVLYYNGNEYETIIRRIDNEKNNL